MRLTQQLVLCCILGLLIVGMSQGCGSMEPDTIDGTFSSSIPSDPNSPSGGSGAISTPTPAPGSGNTPIPNTYGSLESISATGTVNGSAKDPADTSQSVTVYFFIDGAQGTGMSAGSTTANLFNLGNQGGNNRFSYQLPDEFRNGKAHTLHTYAFVNGQYKQIGGSPLQYAAYTPTAEGQKYYEKIIKPQLQNSCSKCHDVSYDAHYSSLIAPTKFNGGTAAGNNLIDKMSGMNHGGGNFCSGGKSADPCAQVQNWWNMEFGN